MSWLKEGIFSLFLSLIALSVCSQNIKFAREIVDSLSGDCFHGRGYVEDGDIKAANFIGEFYRLKGLSSFSENEEYFQKFSFPVNQFFGRMILATSKNQFLTPGQDFLIDPSSPGATFKKRIFRITKDNYLDNQYFSEDQLPSFFDSVIVYSNDKGIISKDSLKAFRLIENFFSERGALIRAERSKLTWSVSRDVSPFPKIHVKPDVLGGKVDSIELIVDQQLLKHHESKNVIGYIEGERKDSYVVITGHYDHLGEMGQGNIFPGANDNASGIAMMLDLINFYAENKPKHSMVFIAFAAEEAGLIGSKFYVDNPLFPLEDIEFLINLDLLGSGEDGITVVNGSVYKKQFKQLIKINKKKKYLAEIKIRGEAANSDHYWFSVNQVPSFFIYARGKSKAYHDIYDVPASLTFAGYDGIFRLITDFVKKQ